MPWFCCWVHLLNIALSTAAYTNKIYESINTHTHTHIHALLPSHRYFFSTLGSDLKHEKVVCRESKLIWKWPQRREMKSEREKCFVYCKDLLKHSSTAWGKNYFKFLLTFDTLIMENERRRRRCCVMWNGNELLDHHIKNAAQPSASFLSHSLTPLASSSSYCS